MVIVKSGDYLEEWNSFTVIDEEIMIHGYSLVDTVYYIN